MRRRLTISVIGMALTVSMAAATFADNDKAKGKSKGKGHDKDKDAPAAEVEHGHGDRDVVLVFNDREVQNRIIQLERYHSSDELRRAANLLTERCRGKTLAQVRAEILREMHEARESMNALMKDAINVAERVFKADEDSRMEYVIAGETNLMGAGELSSVDKLRRLFEAFNEKRDILNLLDHSLRADGVQIFIGQESGFRILDDVSMVTAPYSADNEVVGVIGVIGPTRMAYERVIPIVDLTAKILGAALARR